MFLIGNKKPGYYKNFLMKADPLLHKQVSDIISRHLPAGSSVLDLGAGEGALSQRLQDIGYHVTAADMDRNQFKPSDIPFFQVNFNSQPELDIFIRQNENRFDLVMGIEVIEHVENPFAYVRLLKQLIKPGGFVLITTPNITSWYSRLNFLMHGRFHQFSDSDLSYGHVAPVTSWELGVILRSENMEIITLSPAGRLPMIWLHYSPKIILFNIIALTIRPFMRGIVTGWCISALAKKRHS